MTMHLGRSVLDKEILDRNGFKSGKVDDLRLELREGVRPVVRAIVTQEGAMARRFGGRIARFAEWWRGQVLGLGSGSRPVEVGWEHVIRIDVTVHIDLDRDTAGLMHSENAVWQRWISRIPWADR